MGCVIVVIVILLLGVIIDLANNDLLGQFLGLSIIIFLILKFLFQWLPKIIDDSRIADRENKLSKLPDEMEEKIKSLNREFQQKSEIILKNPDIANSRIENLAAQNTNSKSKKAVTKIKRPKPIHKLKLINLTLIGLLLGYIAYIFLNANYNPLNGLNFYSPIILISWLGLTFMSWGISFAQRNKAMKIAFRYVSFGIFLIGAIWIINLFIDYKSIVSYKYEYYTRDFFNKTNDNYYKMIKPKSFIKYNQAKCDLINTTQHGDMLTVSSNFQIWQKKTYNNVVGGPTGFEQARNYSSSTSLFCKNFAVKNINDYINKPLSLSFYANTSFSGENYRFGFFLLDYLFLFDSQKAYVYLDLDQNSNYWVFLGNPIKDKASYKPDQIHSYEYSANKATNFNRDHSYNISNWKNENNKIDIIFSMKKLYVKVNDLAILSGTLYEGFWESKERTKKLFFILEKNSNFSISPIQITKLNPKTDIEFFKGKAFPVIEQIQTNSKAINVNGFTTNYASLSTNPSVPR
ncbi:MAG: DUF3127 domain-containing protein [Melioribacteraceae bacterium]|nr:DUF3127 domain-containing protein [Melioribacteraceae bacterium]